MRYVNIGAYQVSLLLLLVICITCPVVLSAVYYLWDTRVIPISVEEPLSIVDFPSSLHTHPGWNLTFDVTIRNAAAVNYSVILEFSLNDTAYQAAYVTFSNYTYIITPNTNQILAWISIDQTASPTNIELTVEFHRV